jgi:carbonic anhydrase
MSGTSILRCLVISTILLVVVILPSQGRNRHKLPERRHRYYDHARDQFNNTFNFDDSSKKGPKNWYKKYPDCAGTEQSPIDIVTEDVECDSDLTDFTYQGFDTIQTSPFLLFEVNDAVQIAAFEFEGDGVSIQGAWLPSEFSFHSVYFWAGPGSMHKIDGKSSTLQLGLMHWNSGKYSSNSEAEDKPDGEVGLTSFVQIDDELSVAPENKAFNQAFENVIAGAQMNSSCLLTFPMSSLLPNNRVYYKYHGSLLIPPCHESISWVVFEQPLYITQDQMDRFRKIFSVSGKPAKNNGRPTQQLNGRIVEKLC